MINPLRYLLNKIWPNLKTEEPEFKIGTTRVLALTFEDGKKNYIPQVYIETKESFPFVGDFIDYEWSTVALFKVVPPYRAYGDYSIIETVKTMFDGAAFMEQIEAEEMITKYKRTKSDVKTDYYFFEPK
jgi:hypothetical protein